MTSRREDNCPGPSIFNLSCMFILNRPVIIQSTFNSKAFCKYNIIEINLFIVVEVGMDETRMEARVRLKKMR